jgi:error-prone DNA polymerase
VSAHAYVELDLRSNFSFLEGGSKPDELIVQAYALGLKGVGLADRNTLAGVVRAHRAWRELKESDDPETEAMRARYGPMELRYLVGARLVFQSGDELIVYPRDRAAYGRLSRLLTLGKSRIDADGSAPGHGEPDRIEKGDCRLDFKDAAVLGQGLIALVPAPARIDPAFERRLLAWRQAWPDDLYLAVSPRRRGDDRARLKRLAAMAERAGAPMVATNAVLYHHPDRRPLQDVLTCIREKCTIDEAGYRLEANAERHLKPAAEMARLFRGHEAALARTVEIAGQIGFDLRDLSYHYPSEPVPDGWTANRRLAQLSFAGARTRYPDGVPAKVVETLKKELRLIRKIGYPHYFLTVHDVVEEARRLGILCQGRGSAANSVVCFCLGVTGVDPASQDLLFERFLSEERKEPPDIDVDFEHERREEVMQYMYARYGRHRAAICATVIHYRPRSAIRDVGKAMGLTEDVTAALANTVWGSFGSRIEDDHVDRTGVDRADPRMAMTLKLTQELMGFPRHLSQHVGGFILTEGPLVETVPIGNGAMKDRTFIEWDKDDIDELKIMKVDVLALGMLTCIRKAFDLIERHHGFRPDLAMPPTDARVYDMLCKADSLGVFQVESRAQMSMLPRLLPRVFYDLVVEVAIVRPGPIQGGMVHPYLRRRREKRETEAAGREFRIDYPRPAPEHGEPDELKNVLHKTLGVPLFQEQAMRIAMEAAKFTGDEANRLRKAMATFRHTGTIHTFQSRMVDRLIARGYPPEFANGCFEQIKGFGEYGFPESHAAAFAHLVYVSSWIKCFYPDAFCAALLNSQPMGFYSPAQIVRDARAHGVEVRHPDVNASGKGCTLEQLPSPSRGEGSGMGVVKGVCASVGSSTVRFSSANHPLSRPLPPLGGEERLCAVRLGFDRIDGFRGEWSDAIVAARDAGGLFTSMDDLRTRAALPAAALDRLAAADAFASLNLTRRPALWDSKGLPRTGKAAAPAPLFAYAGLDEGDGAEGVDLLPALPPSEEVVADYETIRLSLKGHPVGFLRERLKRAGAIPAAEIERVKNGRRTAVAGVVLVRQRPGTAKGVVFMTIEDETGVANVVVWPKTFERFRPVVMGARLILVRGRVERAEDAPRGPNGEGGVIHLIADHIEDRTGDLDLLSEGRLKPPREPGDEAASASPGRGEARDLPQPAPRHHHPRDVRVLPKSRDFH